MTALRRGEARTSRLPIDPDLPAPPGRGDRPPFGIVSLGLVALGGGLGSLSRYEVSLALPDHPGHFPATTLLVNVSGAFLIGVILTSLVDLGRAGSPRLFSCVGILGGWTTMSTLALDADELIVRGRVDLMIAYALASIIGGAIATALGMLVADRTLARRDRTAVQA